MFCLITRSSAESDILNEALTGLFGQIEQFDGLKSQHLETLLSRKVQGLAVDCRVIGQREPQLVRALLGLSDVVPTVYFNLTEEVRLAATAHRPVCATFCVTSEPQVIIDALNSLMTRVEVKDLPPGRGIPLFEKHYALRMLKEGGGLSLLAIDASSLSGIEARFGRKAFEESVLLFHDLLGELWGASGCFRARDMLCCHREMSLVYLIILEANRLTGRMPPPGSLEKIADRVQAQIDNRLWQSRGEQKTRQWSLPRGMAIIPQIRVGYSSAASSLLEDDERLVDRIVGEAVRATALQEKRIQIRRKEYLHNVIAASDSLRPNFQAVFHLQNLRKEDCDAAHRAKALGPLKHLLFGFESLIRAQHDVIMDLMGSSQFFTMDPHLLVPDVLFTLAKSVGAELELDLRAMKQALTFGQTLPGKLMINILPRNFYNLKRLRKNLPHDSRIIFEVSESEAIENFDLVQEVRADLRHLNIGVATDDFGRDYGGLERIFKIRPDIIKLDRALISNIHLDAPRLAFVAGLVQSVKVIEAATLAEGVELWEEAAALQSIGVELIQGYLLHRPERAESIHESLATETSTIEKEQSESPIVGRVIPLKAS